jgi:hypothetical protein
VSAWTQSTQCRGWRARWQNCIRRSLPRADEPSPQRAESFRTIFAKGRGAATIYILCDGPIESIGRVRPYHAPEAELATIVHAGSHRNIDIAYGALATHVARYERAADGPLREHYLVGPLDTSDESAWRTEIGWPILKVAERSD